MKKLLVLVSLFLLLTLVAVGCGNGATTTTTAFTTPTVVKTTTATATTTTTTTATTTVTTKAEQPAVTLKIGSLPRIFDLVLYAAVQDGTFEKNNLKVEIVPFTSVIERNSAFLAGQLDGYVDSIYEAINMNKEVQTCQVAGHNLMPGMFNIVVSPRSGIADASQLKGAKIATSTGTIMDYALDKLLATKGLTSADVTYVNVPKMPLRLTMLDSGDVTAAIFTPPLSVQAVASGNKVVLDDSARLLAGPGLIFNMSAVNNKAQGIRDFVKSWNQEVTLIKNNPDNYRTLLVKTAQVPEALAATYTIPEFPQVRLPAQAEVSDLSDWMKAKGLIKTDAIYDQLVIK